MGKNLETQLDECFNHIDIPSNNADKLQHYVELIKIWNKKINLVSKKEQGIVSNLIAPSLLFFKTFKENNYNIIDLGSGAGFPSLVFKIYKPTLNITMVDSNHKKTSFLNYTCSALKMNCKIMNTTFEKLNLKNISFDIITTRGVNIDENLLNLIKTKIQSRWLVYFTSPKIYLPLDLRSQLRLNSTSMKVYRL